LTNAAAIAVTIVIQYAQARVARARMGEHHIVGWQRVVCFSSGVVSIGSWAG
jgi:hypothetical protein